MPICAGVEIGRALAGFIPLGYLDERDRETLLHEVRYGIDLAQAEQNGR